MTLNEFYTELRKRLATEATNRFTSEEEFRGIYIAIDIMDKLFEESEEIESICKTKSPMERTRVFIKTQMPCGCPVGQHAPGPCGHWGQTT